MAEFFNRSALRIFAILLYEEKFKLIEHFYDNGFNDSMLPGTLKRFSSKICASSR